MRKRNSTVGYWIGGSIVCTIYAVNSGWVSYQAVVIFMLVLIFGALLGITEHLMEIKEKLSDAEVLNNGD